MVDGKREFISFVLHIIIPMVFFSKSLAGLIVWCRALKHGLKAGLSLPRVFQLQAEKGPSSLRPCAHRIALCLEKGDSLEDACDQEGDRLPKLFRELVSIGERTGHLPEIFGELSDYYELQQTLGRQFRSQISWPVFQLFAAVGVIAVLIWIMGELPRPEGSSPIAPIGFGLVGLRGAVIFLIAVIAWFGGLFGVYLLITRVLQRRAAFEAFLLRLPAIGPCASALTMGRFCLALRMTQETGMSAPEAVRQSLLATGNSAFTIHLKSVLAKVKSGSEIHTALRRCTAFPQEFLESLAIAEVSGQIPEVMIRQAEIYREEAARRLKELARMAGFAVWLIVAILMIIAIFRIAGIYFNALDRV